MHLWVHIITSFSYPLYIPTVNILSNISFIVSNGTYILINVPITIKGPNGIYSLDFLIFVISNIILKTAPIKNDNNVITASANVIPNSSNNGRTGSFNGCYRRR